jgi:hypothetical protein
LNDIKDYIVSYYKNLESTKLNSIEIEYQKGIRNAFTNNPGIGDVTIINQLLFLDENKRSDINILSYSRHFNDIIKFNKFGKTNHINGEDFIRTELLEMYNLGSGHIIQKMRRFFNLPVLNKPKSFLNTGKEKVKNKIGIHLTTGQSAFELSNLNFRPRQIYQENLEILKKFIKENNQYTFVEFGGQSLNIENCVNFCGKTLAESIEELSTCEYFIGLNSGFMNLAACFDIKSIIIVNIPIKASDLVLPVLKDVKIPDMNWLYPQNVHLHQDNESLTVPKFSHENIRKAIEGNIYPFWKDECLNLIYD